MTIWQVLILSFVQGIAEFLPISSSGHLILIPKFFNWIDQGLVFDTMMHLATLLAVIVFFRKKIFLLLKSFFSRSRDLEIIKNKKLAYFILIAIVPAGLAGFLFEDSIELYFRSATLVAINLIFWALILFLADKYNSKLNNKKDILKISWKDSVFIGLAQVLALIPGTSRSGITISAGLFNKIKKEDAIEFSFLISIPLIAGAGLLQLIDLFKNGLGNISFFLLFLGFSVAFLSGLLAIKFLLEIIKRWSFLPFVIYRIILAIIILILL